MLGAKWDSLETDEIPSFKPQDNPPVSSQKSIDWRDKGAVNPVGHQGSCAASWAFASVASIEGADFIKNGKLQKLSEQ